MSTKSPLSWADCPFGVPASADAMTTKQEDWALAQMAREAIEEQARSGEPSIPWDEMVAQEAETRSERCRTAVESIGRNRPPEVEVR